MTRTLALALLLVGSLAGLAVAQDSSQRLTEIEELAQRGKPETALQLATVFASDHPADVDAQVLYQDLALAAGQRKQLIRAYRSRLQGVEPSADGTYLIARVLEGRSAMSEFKKALKLDPHHLRTLLAMGSALLDEGELDDARETFERSIECRPQSVEARLGLAETVRLQGDGVHAEELLRAVLEDAPHAVLPRVDLGVLLFELRRYEEAEAVLREAAERAPNDALPQLALGQLERVRGRDPEALAAYDEKRRLREEEEALAAEKAEKERADAGVDDVPGTPEDEDQETEPSEPRTPNGRAQLRFQRAVECAPSSVPALVLLAHASIASGQNASALVAIETGLRLAPESLSVLAMDAYLELEELRAAHAETTARSMLGIERRSAIAHYLHGIAQQRQGTARKAEKSYEKAVKESDEDPLFVRAVAALHAMQGRWRDALRAYAKVVTLTDEEPRSVLDLARAQRGAGKAKEAATTLEELVAREPEARDAWLLLGQICHHDLRKKTVRAIAAYEQYVALGGEDESALSALDELGAD